MVHTAKIKGSDWHVSVGGLRDVQIDDVDELLGRARRASPDSIFQVFDADKVAGWRHLFFAAVNAVKSHDSGSAISRNLVVEVMLYASCKDQISRAFEVMGVSQGRSNVALLVLSESPKEAEIAYKRISEVLGADDDSVLEVSAEKRGLIKSTFGISNLELEAVGGPTEDALTRLIIEIGALLKVRR
ncbi:MAG TPA: KEOPS complex subunit Cgi121 [Patescibacteria group bacterium]|nr:KEOPS complex subunit Cgi121 [Patescibacteria group bacterium]